jgi:hypothetical protein
MTSIEEDGPHVHEPCTSCGLVEAEPDSNLCAECAEGRDEG